MFSLGALEYFPVLLFNRLNTERCVILNGAIVQMEVVDQVFCFDFLSKLFSSEISREFKGQLNVRGFSFLAVMFATKRD